MSWIEARISIPGPAIRVVVLAAVIAVAAVVALAPPIAGAMSTPDECGFGGEATRAVVAEGAVDQSKAVSLLFLPGPIRSPEPLLVSDLQAIDGFAVGLFSPTIGRYGPTQVMLDISQGARVASSLYRPSVLAAPGIVFDPVSNRALIKNWRFIERRANNTPGEVRPGALASALASAGRSVAWLAPEGSPHVSAVAAAAGSPAGCGEIGRAAVVPVSDLEAQLIARQGDSDLVVATLPSGGVGLGMLKRIASRSEDRMLIVAQAPPDPARTRLMPIAVRGLGGRGGIRSASTRRPGLVSASDIAPTILDRLGVSPPSAMQGRPITAAPRASAQALSAMNARLSLIAGRRLPFGLGVVLFGALIVSAVLALARLTGRTSELTARLRRIVALAFLWLPTMLLLTAALRPTRMIEVDVALAGSVMLALVTDKLIAWPRAPWLPVAAAIVAHGLDFTVFESYFTGQSLLGSNPLYGARFFGAGNELEAVFVTCGVIAAGAFMCDRPRISAARGFACFGALLALFLGLGRVGADVGGVIGVAAGFGVAALHTSKTRLTPARIALLTVIPFLALGLIAGIDSISGGESHLTRTVVRAQSLGDLLEIVDRRTQASIEGARQDGIWVVILLSLGLLTWSWRRRRELFGVLAIGGEDPDARRPYRAALVGGAVATVVGALANDSGPAILIIGTIYLGMGLLYMRGRPVAPVTAGTTR